ncbi:hypothetical protein J5X84_41710 [Streptosporangiaceae bacterium NEAU-GS5]|nr:hypothetical protein [Streptosporangiaceae bacterium NEAU-GS5]
MIARIATGVLAGVAAAALPLASGAAVAATKAEPTVIVQSIEKSPLTVGTHSIPVTVTVESNAPTVTLLVHPGNSATPTKDFTGTHDGDIWTFRGTFGPADQVGPWWFEATATADGGATKKYIGVSSVYRVTRFVSFHVQPRVVRKGGQVLFSGRVRATSRGQWGPLANSTVNIQVDKGDGADEPTYVATLPTDANGRFSGRVAVDVSGRYSAYVSASGPGPEDFLAYSQTHEVFVKVRKKKH